MADIICRWRNGTPKTVVELVNSLPHKTMPNEEFRLFMQNSVWGSEFFHTPYQLACQLGLYCEAEDGLYYPRFDHDINEDEAREYLEYWMPRYYVPNPYVGRNGFNDIMCPTYVLYELYKYATRHPNCTYKEAYKAVFHEEPTNNNDIVKNYINNYSKVLYFDSNGYLTITKENPLQTFSFMDRSNKKDFFDNFSKNNEYKKTITTLQQIFYGAPGTGKSHCIKDLTKNSDNIVRTTFHPDSDYSTFVGAYKPTTKQVPMRDVTGKVIKENGQDVTEDRIIYEFVNQAFLQAYINAWKLYAESTEGEPEKQYLIIEEINRGNCAQIFGDLFQLLDRNYAGFSEYPIKADADMKNQLVKAFKGLDIVNKKAINQYFNGKDVVEKVLKGEELVLPNNLYIWATMNTSDQSLFPIDSAFKRRWDWQYMPITDGKKGWKIEVNGKRYDWWQFLQKINDRIGTTTNSEDKKLGYFFCKSKDGVIDAETFVGKVLFYIWNDVYKDFAEEAGDLFLDVDGTVLSFSKFYTVGEDGKAKVVEDKVERLLGNLGVVAEGETIDVEETENEGMTDNN